MTINQVPPSTCSPSSSVIQQQITDFYNNLPAGEVASGLSVGVINGVDSSGDPVITKYYSGYANVKQGTPIAEDTDFEIGSTTKTFTTTMLAAAVNAGTIDLNENAQTYYDTYDPSVTLPVYIDPNTGDTYQMTILDLADFTSGIPDKSPTNTKAPYGYSFPMMHDYLKNLDGLPVQPGTVYEYVNTNFAIIAEILMLMNKFGTYEDALKQLITDAGLKMPHTGVIGSNTLSIPNLAQGYQFNGNIEKNYALTTWPALVGAGGICSTIDDMLYWLQFNMGLTDSSYNDVLPMLHGVRFPAGSDRGEGLGWFVNNLKGTKLELIDKNGGTSGFHSWIGFLPDSQIGAILLCNTKMPGLPKSEKVGSPVDNLGEAILKALVNPT